MWVLKGQVTANHRVENHPAPHSTTKAHTEREEDTGGLAVSGPSKGRYSTRLSVCLYVCLSVASLTASPRVLTDLVDFQTLVGIHRQDAADEIGSSSCGSFFRNPAGQLIEDT